MQHIIMLFSRSEIQHRNARTDLALPKTTIPSPFNFFESPQARGSESPAAGGRRRGWATATQLTAAIMSLYELL
jgi:hypothetical protein